MASYRVTEAPRHGSPVLYLSAGALIFAALLSLGMRGLSTVPIAVEGEAQLVTLGTTVSDAVEEGVVTMPRSDVIDASGTVLAVGRGESAVLVLNGEVAPGDHRLRPGDVLTVRTRKDVVEDTVVSREPIPIPVEYEGEGPLMALASPGAVGIRETVRGDVSRRELETHVVTDAEPMVLRRYRPDPGSRVVALTFDDGPWPGSTLEICEILENEGVPGNFFMLGRQVRAHPDLAARVAQGGHLIGNHSFSHAYLRAATPEAARFEIVTTQYEIAKVTGEYPTWYRPAGGITSPAVWDQTLVSKVRLINWTVDPRDYRLKDPVQLAGRVFDAVEPGSVILMHDGGGDRTATVKALTTIIRELKSRGYTIVTLDEMFPEQ